MKPVGLHLVISRVRRRVLLTRLIHALSYAIPAAVFASTIVVLLHSLNLVGADTLLTVVLSLATAVLAGGATFAALGASTRRLAWDLDQRAALQDRLTNALYFSGLPTRHPLMDLAIADAETVAPTLPLETLVPVWQPGYGRRLATLLLAIPLVYAAAAINWLSLLREPAKSDIQGIAQPLPSELAEEGFRDLPAAAQFLPALTGLRGLVGDWRARLTELRENARQLAMQAPAEPTLPETIYKEDMAEKSTSRPMGAGAVLAADGLPAVRPNDRLNPTDLRALGEVDANIDSSMRKAFEQLDSTLLDKDPRLASVQAYVDNMRDNSNKGMDAASNLMMQSLFGQNQGHEGDPMGSFRNKTQGAQQQSFSEFLQEYSKHLGRMVDAKQDVNDKRAANQKSNPTQQNPVLVSDQGQPLPPDGEMRMVKMDPNLAQGVKLNTEIGQQINPNNGPSKAGRGGGTYRGAIKMKHEDVTGTGRQETLQGQVGEGRSSVQILEDLEGADKASYDKIMATYQSEAKELLQDPTIPMSIRAYVQRYLSSISSGQ